MQAGRQEWVQILNGTGFIQSTDWDIVHTADRTGDSAHKYGRTGTGMQDLVA
jgi:hypothetical protein